MATTPYDEIALVELPAGPDRAAFHREVADRIIEVWRRREQRLNSDEAAGPGPQLLTVADMTARIGRVYDALVPRSTRVGISADERANAPEPMALWVVAVGDLGGVARHVLDATRAGIPGWRIFVLCPEGPLTERLRAQGSAVLTAPISPTDSLAGGVRAVRHAIRTLRPAIVHSHLAYSDFLVAGASLPRSGMTAKLVSTEHGIAGDDLVYHGTRWRSRVMAAAHAVRLRRFDALIAVADATLAAVHRKWHPQRGLKTVVIPNGVDTPIEPPPAAPGRLHVISLSRLAPEKGLPDLVAAFALVHAEHPDATLTLAGDGPLRSSLEQQVADLGLTDAVALPGYVEAESLLHAGDVLAQLSTWENCSYSLLDAVAHHVPVVATGVGGNCDSAGKIGRSHLSLAAATATQILGVTGKLPARHTCAKYESIRAATKPVNNRTEEFL